jgi:hypothetical protein
LPGRDVSVVPQAVLSTVVLRDLVELCGEEKFQPIQLYRLFTALKSGQTEPFENQGTKS